MRESPWRSHAPPLLLAPALFALGACAPQFDLSKSPPPCIDGYSPCPLTGLCQPDDPKAIATEIDTGSGTPMTIKLPLNCPSTLTVRQSSALFLAAPGVARPEDITVESLPGERLKATPTIDHGRVGVTLEAPPGTPPGDELIPLYKKRFITMKTKVGGYVFDRTVLVIVSTINAGPDGSDQDNAGIFTSPFATFRHAAEVAQPGDTIDLRNVGDTDMTPVLVRSGVTVRSIAVSETKDMNTGKIEKMAVQVTLPMEVDLEGDANLEGLVLFGARLVIDAPGSHVVLRNVSDDRGLTVSANATVPPGAVGTNVEIIGQSTLTNRLAPSQSPLLVQADGATVTIDSPGTTVNASELRANVDTIRFEGRAQTLTIGSFVVLGNQDNAPAVHLVGATNLTVNGFTRFINPVLIDDPTSDADFHGAAFNAASLTFNGRALSLLDNTTFSDSPLTFRGETLKVFDTTFTGQGIAATAPAGRPKVAGTAELQTATFKNAPVAFDAGDVTIMTGTSFDNSPLRFGGSTLHVTGAVFTGVGIEQHAGTSTLDNVEISNYTQFGYRLANGKATITGSRFAHDPAVTPSPDGKTPPWALWVDAAGDSDSSVSSQGTLYDSKPFAPQPCTVYGPDAVSGLYSISQHIEISFCN
jgi:hypothetical protein